jgi:hypothetical protein
MPFQGHHGFSGVMKKIFISYSHQDKEYIPRLERLLHDEGFDYFVDSKKIEPGDDLSGEIEKQLSETTHLIIFISDSSLKSNWVTFELGIAKGKGIHILPIILRENLKTELPSFLSAYFNIEFTDREIELPKEVKGKIIDFLISDGIIPRKLLDHSKKRLKGEVIAVELLTQNIVLEKNKFKEIEVVINRNDVKYALISTTGKNNLSREFVKNREKKLRKLDQEIHRFLLGRSTESSVIIPVRDEGLPFRWSSGGILSILNYKERDWVPFFFRDIPPVGWNISLGCSERYFDENWNTIGDFNEELNDPWKFIRREFLEETLVLNNDPGRERHLVFKKFYFGDKPTADEMKQADHFSQEHIRLRQNEDGIYISQPEDPISNFRDCCIKVNFSNTKTEVTIVDQGKKSSPKWNILICFNLLELGIEIVRVIHYRLQDEDYLLDGEILVNDDGSKELVRMPVALISLDYLKKEFEDEKLHYTEGPQPSVICSSIKKKDIHVFQWDAKKRQEDRQNLRHIQWKEKFSKYFIDQNGQPVVSGFNSLFTPASVKIISYYFANLST